MRMGIGLGVGINRSNYAQGIFNAYSARVVADGGVVESGICVDAVSSLLQSASLLLIPSGYKGGKLYSEIPTNGNGDLTWTRASDAWRTNADGLIQRVPWNLLQYSEAFDNAYWSKISTSITANDAVSPNGTNTADLFVFTGTGYATSPSSILVNGTTYILSVYVRAKNTSGVVRLAQNTSVDTIVTSQTYSVDTNWQRISFTFTAGATSSKIAIAQRISGDTDYYYWGAQLVEGTTAQTYLPTTDRLNFPRLSYMYGSCPSALLEPQRTNLALWSEDFSNAIYTKTSVTVTANSTTAPDGNTTADTLSKSAGVDATCTQEIIATSTGYAGTVFIKQDNDETRFPEFFLRSSSSSGQNEIYVQLNTKTGAIATRLTTGTTSASTPVLINGYWRMSLYVLANSNTVRVGLRPAAGTTLGVFNANASGSIIAWGMQVEPNAAYPTTYIPTTSATATRVADSFSRNNIYTNGLISASGGTWFVELKNNIAMPRVSGYPTLYISSNTVGTSTLTLGFASNVSATRLVLYSWISGAFTSIGTLSTDNVKVAFAFTTTTLKVFVNGSVFASYTGLTIDPTTIQNLIGNSEVTMFIQQMALFNSALTDAQCQTLTTL